MTTKKDGDTPEQEKLDAVPDGFNGSKLELSEDGTVLTYTYDSNKERAGVSDLLSQLSNRGIRFKDLQTRESSLEDIFVSLVGDGK